jgi:RNA polymerase sigma-70 factor (ECF subfamily)
MLPEPYREAVRLRYWGGISCEEAAAALGVPLGTLTKRLSRAHALLRESLEGGANTYQRKGHDDELRAVP